MSRTWQTVLIAAVVLPLGGFVAGAVMSSSADTPPARPEIVVPSESPGPSRSTGPTTAPTTTSSTTDPTTDPFEVVTPDPSNFDYDDHGDDHSGDDHSGSGSSDSGSSGSDHSDHSDRSGHGGGSDD